jgi:Secretion system C-terminal sorting domain
MGIPGGAAMPDCNGICGGPGVYGNVNGDLLLDSLDVQEYSNILETTPAASTSCNDLNGDGILTVYDAALANWCIHTPHHPHPAGSSFNDCNFPHNILNPDDSTGLAISSVNFTSGYVDIELKSITADIKAYQFSMHGINVSSVISLSDPIEFPVDIRVINGTNEIFAISVQDSNLNRANLPQLLCRVYFSSITDTIICIENIREIINQKAERTVTYIYGGCVNTTFSGLNNFNAQLHVALIPNPVSGLAHLQMPLNFVPDKVEIIDMTGRIIAIPAINNERKNEIDLNFLSSGVYLLKVQSSGQTGYTRFSKL